MENSILDSTKKVLGLDDEYNVFDLDIITFINTAFGVLTQLGIGPVEGFAITGSDETWDTFDVPLEQKSLVRTYIFLRVRMLFDPPTTSYFIEATQKQLDEYEWRLSSFREEVVWTAQKAAEAAAEEASQL